MPPPPLATDSDLAAGLAPPAAALKERLDGVTASTGAAGATTSVTGMSLRRAGRARGLHGTVAV